jgi:hypothetical protein
VVALALGAAALGCAAPDVAGCVLVALVGAAEPEGLSSARGAG